MVIALAFKLTDLYFKVLDNSSQFVILSVVMSVQTLFENITTGDLNSKVSDPSPKIRPEVNSYIFDKFAKPNVTPPPEAPESEASEASEASEGTEGLNVFEIYSRVCVAANIVDIIRATQSCKVNIYRLRLQRQTEELYAC